MLTLVARYGDPDVPGTGECVDYDRATACKTFNQPTTPCLYSCPRLECTVLYNGGTGVGPKIDLNIQGLP